MSNLVGLVEVLKAGGPYAMAAIFLFGWWIERKDRREKETHLRSVYDKIVVLVQESTVASDRMQGALTALKDAIQTVNGRLR